MRQTLYFIGFIVGMLALPNEQFEHSFWVYFLFAFTFICFLLYVKDDLLGDNSSSKNERNLQTITNIEFFNFLFKKDK